MSNTSLALFMHEAGKLKEMLLDYCKSHGCAQCLLAKTIGCTTQVVNHPGTWKISQPELGTRPEYKTRVKFDYETSDGEIFETEKEALAHSLTLNLAMRLENEIGEPKNCMQIAEILLKPNMYQALVSSKKQLSAFYEED